MSRNSDAEEILVQTIIGVAGKDATIGSDFQPSFAVKVCASAAVARQFSLAFIRASIWGIIAMSARDERHASCRTRLCRQAGDIPLNRSFPTHWGKRPIHAGMTTSQACPERRRREVVRRRFDSHNPTDSRIHFGGLPQDIDTILSVVEMTRFDGVFKQSGQKCP